MFVQGRQKGTFPFSKLFPEFSLSLKKKISQTILDPELCGKQ